MPRSGPHRTVVVVDGDHSLRRDLVAVGHAVGGWLGALTSLA
jgi:hypothetical protein